ncbi:MAG: hypothetical protein UU48_C0043G0003 [Candidatus Uhrbacteria bacterium GW2011_GWF2_41_16]|uniref:Uncharacterized protein n=1 Tax=Candidatus Uhrbacteria bacterium GW2011_GWF2_41_16 TaxID=1618997 RepID=A0A0G0V487_9BACT|nr:MAG: hypothetical protein UU48_C0043G0003 [Candidatus Uhrbacteria bacterium GW2011_GWF2_41_16]
MDKLQGAVDSFKKALTIDPSYSDARTNLGIVYGKMDQWDDAINEFNKALSNPKYTTPQIAHYNLGYAYFNKGDYQSAIVEFKEAAKIQPEIAMFYQLLGNSYTKLDMTKDAITAYEEAKRLDPANVDIYYNLGFAYYKEEKRSEAMNAFKKVVELAPDSTAAEESMKYIDILKEK